MAKTQGPHRIRVREGDVMSHGPVEKDPEDWKAGDEPMAAPQESYLRTLAREAGETCPTTSPRRRPLSSSISYRPQ